jgi:hypothetical protein
VAIALVNDYDIGVMGIAHILEQYRDRMVSASVGPGTADRVRATVEEQAQPGA